MRNSPFRLCYLLQVILFMDFRRARLALGSPSPPTGRADLKPLAASRSCDDTGQIEQQQVSTLRLSWPNNTSAALVYAFLLSLLAIHCAAIRNWLLRHWCHRIGKRSREVSAQLYRLRSALSLYGSLILRRPYRRIRDDSCLLLVTVAPPAAGRCGCPTAGRRCRGRRCPTPRCRRR
jgi:hypothetical protein